MTTVTHQLVVRAGRAVFPDGIRPATVVVDDGLITAVLEAGAEARAREEIVEADDHVLMPGLVDSHVHVNEPGRTAWEGYESATRAGLVGGITTILDMPLNSSPPTTTVANLEAKVAATQGLLSVDVGFWGGAVPDNIDQMGPLWDRGVFGFKCFTPPTRASTSTATSATTPSGRSWPHWPNSTPCSSSAPRTSASSPRRPRTSPAGTPPSWPPGPVRPRTPPSSRRSPPHATPVPGCTSSVSPPPRPCPPSAPPSRTGSG